MHNQKMLRIVSLLALLLLTNQCRTLEEPSIRPCIESRPLVEPSDPRDGLSPEKRIVRNDFIRTCFASTVYIHSNRYNPNTGMSYWVGTGIIIDKEGSVLTAFHVVKDTKLVVVGIRQLMNDIRVVTRLRDVPMEVVAFSEEFDVALLKPLHGETLPQPLPFNRDWHPTKNEELWHFGNTSWWSQGKVVQTSTSFVVEVNMRSHGGDSGGPLVDMQGEVVGILLAANDAKKLSYFITIGEALKILHYKH